MDSRASEQTGTAYRERWVVPWWGWVGLVAIAGLMAAEIHLGQPGVYSWAPYVTLFPLSLVILVVVSRIKLSVDDAELRVDDAHIERRFLLAAEALAGEEKRRALGPELDPVAFVVHRPWVRGTVRIYLDDADDPTPYWILSSRRPEALLAALDLPLPAPE
jgi:hypothetical protein